MGKTVVLIALLLVGVGIDARPVDARTDTTQIIRLVQALAPSYRLDPNLVLAVIETESGFNPKARSPKNAQGLMQLIPATAARFGVEDVWDPEQNLRGGMAYLRWLLDYFDGDLKLALAGYNAGEKAVKRYGGIPPYPETRAYVRRILAKLRAMPKVVIAQAEEKPLAEPKPKLPSLQLQFELVADGFSGSQTAF